MATVSIRPSIPLRGVLELPPSKSEAIRAALLLALSGRGSAEALTGYEGRPICLDIKAAINASSALMRGEPLEVGASASLLRMILPTALALHGRAEIVMDPRLKERGLSEFVSCLGVELSFDGDRLIVEKRLLPGLYEVDCTRSSQFLSGLLIALPLLKDESVLRIIGSPVSKSYADMTIAYASLFGARIGSGFVSEDAEIMVYPSKYSAPRAPYALPDGRRAFASGDCSYAAFFGAANAMGGRVETVGVSGRTLQPDIAFPALAGYSRIDLTGVPDLLPPLAAVACALDRETVLCGTARLAYKESSRAQAMAELINALGGSAEAGEDELIIRGTGSLRGGECSSFGDHRIAMAAAALASICQTPVVLCGAECVEKSAPSFWNDFKDLGGEYEFIRQ